MIQTSNCAALQAAPVRIGAILAVAVLLAAGCATTGGKIDSLHVFSVPVALDLDGSPGADGFGLTLYASAAARPRGIPITSGTLEFLMFDGAVQTDAKTNTVPRRVWTLPAADLKKHVIKTSLGTGYRFTPSWRDTPPSQGRITIIVRYRPSGDQPSLQSSPTTIAVTAN